ncbi:DUF3800 domain-containing protein [Amycolatopsis sp. NPDC023774]|uniref:DUF3800 domain-containing protein n=1 Tax=Amycolatopsis sp. NPDC023774 TaxID=3155015 RepID=UPI0033DF314B
MSRTIACDESGSEGVNLIGANTDVFAHAGVRVDVGAAADCVGELRERIGSPALEYKANHLLRAKNRAALVWLLGPSGPLAGRAGVVLVDKALFVTGKVVDLLVDRVPYPDCLARRPDSRAVVLHRDGQRLHGPRWSEFLQSFTTLLRTSQRRGPGLTPSEFFAQDEVLSSLAQVPEFGADLSPSRLRQRRPHDPEPRQIKPWQQRGSTSIEQPQLGLLPQRGSNRLERPQTGPEQQGGSHHHEHPRKQLPQRESHHREHPQTGPHQQPEPHHREHPRIQPPQRESNHQRIGSPPAREHLTELRERLRADPSLVPPLDPLMPALVDTVTHWHPTTVIHDEQPSLTPARLATLLGPTRDVQFVDSRADPRVQLADFLAGVTRRLAEDALHHRGDPELTALLRPYMLPASIWTGAL